MIIWILMKLLVFHIYFSILNFVIYELIKFVWGHRIISNGWAGSKEYTEYYEQHPEKDKSNPYDLLYFAVMFIPFLNVSCTADLLEMIMYTPEQIEEMEREEMEENAGGE